MDHNQTPLFYLGIVTHVKHNSHITSTCSAGVLQCCSASVPVHKVTVASAEGKKTLPFTAISHQPPAALHMLMPLQPVTLTFMTSLSTLPDIMLVCHCHDLWPE